ncbi:sigma-54-dependent Fis family transcriptional regulator [Clostridium sediminicola]|uniref:sigma-54-dependent Fis family transcriptional regulator n=1 Tax=Clostridium sediminicola TaxID=3114879 RepID=UPI0031F2203D
MDTFEKKTNITFDSIIEASLRRSREYGINAENPEIKILTGESLETKLEQNSELLKFGEPIINKLFELVKGTQYVISLHDKEGYVLYIVGVDPKKAYEDYSFTIGSKWSEDVVGTSGSGLALMLDTPIQVVAEEHYCKKQWNATCSAAPIHDNNGNLIGCINMSGEFVKSHEHTLGMVASAAFSIEKQISLSHSYELITNTLNTISEGMIVLDENLIIKSMSKSAMRILNLNNNEIYKNSITNLFNPPNFYENIFKIKRPFSYLEYELKLNNKVFPLNISITPMEVKNKVIGAIILFRESKAINHVANMISGNQSRYTFRDIITSDDKIKDIITIMKQISTFNCSVLIEGESGTGKELFAHSIHSESNRRKGPFIAVNCASLPQSLVESELFGYEKGAFTGALNSGNPGKFELANGGTIFLDEIGELPLDIQAKLLRVLDTHRALRIGGKTEKELDIRVIAATNRNLEEEVKNNNFREDLYYRINVLKFKIPPLRDRHKDVIKLSHFFLNKITSQPYIPDKVFSSEFLIALTNYTWPGNVRELQNVISRAYYTCKDYTITCDNLPENISRYSSDQHSTEETLPIQPLAIHKDITTSINELEKELIENALKKHNGHIINAGKSINMSKSSIYRKIKKYNIKTNYS